MRSNRERRDWGKQWRYWIIVNVLAMFVVLLPSLARRAAAQEATPNYSVSYSFAGGKDGSLPAASLIADSAGNLYGTTTDGGVLRDSCFGGCGVIFRMNAQGGETVLYSFTGGSDGSRPFASLVRDSVGNLYGTTTGGGNQGSSCPNSSYGCGVVFKLDPQGKETVLHTFGTVAADGANPQAGLIQDATGNLYGTATSYNGGSTCTPGFACGVVFRVDKTGQHYKVLYRFTGGADGATPQGGLVRDAAGNLYGTTAGGGNTSSSCPFAAYGCGVVFKVDPQGNETVLYSFTGGTDGAEPLADLIRDSGGNLFGTTFIGGTVGGSCPNTYGCGVVFKVDSLGNETVVHTFTGGADGSSPMGSLVASHGSQYGTANRGGTYDGGVVFKIQR